MRLKLTAENLSLEMVCNLITSQKEDGKLKVSFF